MNDRAPFDISSLLRTDEAQSLSSTDAEGVDYVPNPPLRRGASGGDISAHVPPATHAPEVAAPSGTIDAAEDAINPSHYRRHPSGIECIEVVRHCNFNIGNSIKYLWRYLDKGDPVENLKKAQWYIDDEIRRLQGSR